MREKGELMVYKSNEFIQNYKYSLSTMEIRIINYMIANIGSPKYDTEFHALRFSIGEFASLLSDKKHGDIYKRTKETIKQLADKSAWTKVEDEETGKTKEILIRWIEEPEIEEGYVTLKLNRHLAPYLLQMSGYIKSQFRYSLEAQSRYTIPLYELLKSWEKVKDGIKVFTLEYLRTHLDAMVKTYDNFAAFDRRVLSVAVGEINDITDLDVTYEPLKQGRKITQIQFSIKRKPSAKDDEDDFEKMTPDFSVAEEDVLEEEPQEDFVSERVKQLWELLSDACDGEFSQEQIILLCDDVKEKLRVKGVKSQDPDLDTFHYLRKKYLEMNMRKPKSSRFGYLRTLINSEE